MSESAEDLREKIARYERDADVLATRLSMEDGTLTDKDNMDHDRFTQMIRICKEKLFNLNNA